MVIPSNVTVVGDLAFAECKSLEFVTFENPDVNIGTWVFENSKDVALICPENTNAFKYCEDNNLRWSSSKDIEAIIIEPIDASEEVSE